MDTICLAAVTISLDMIPVFFMTYVVGFLESLCDQLKSVSHGNADKPEVIYKKFVKCIEFQLEIDEYIEKVHRCFSKVLFVQGLISILILCTSTISMTVVSW